MANIRLPPFLFVLFFICFPPTLAVEIPNLIKGPTVTKIKNKKIGVNWKRWFHRVIDSVDDTTTTVNAEDIGFFVTFNVSTTPVTARISISSTITWLENYQPSYSSTYQCCTENLTCSKTICSRDYFALADTFSFQGGQLSNVPYNYTPGNKTQNTEGFLSFSRSPYSVLSIAKEQSFSYFFSDFLNSNVTLGPVTDAAALQSTNIVTNPSYPDLYYVNLTQISIGNSSYRIDPTTNSSIVILDTVILPTLLETTVYANVKLELIKLGKPFKDTDSGLELCYSNKPAWPNLTLFFPSNTSSSAGTQMVLIKDSYVVTVQSGAECAAILESVGGSVIGVFAQINRGMNFNISSSGSRLYFSQYPASGAAVLRKATLTGILIWLFPVLLYLNTPVCG